MAETTEFYCTGDEIHPEKGYHRWIAENVRKDLIEQGGLEPSYLNLVNNGFDSYLAVHRGSHRGNPFVMRWIKDSFLVLMLDEEDSTLVEGFSKVIGQKPFLKYVHPIDNKITYEWESVNKEKRIRDLQERKISDLTILE